MNIGTNGIVVDQFGQVLLILRDDTRTWAMPGGSLEAGELPTDGVAREVAEETGLDVLPARLVGVYFWAIGKRHHLIFTFRCLVQGGELRASDESPRVGYLPGKSPPRPMLHLHRERLEHGLAHQGGRPYWGRQELSPWWSIALRTLGPVVYARKAWQRRRKGEPAYRRPPWSVGAFVVIGDEEGRVLWVKRNDYDVWNLPGGKSDSSRSPGKLKGEAPWETAVRETREETGLGVRLNDLVGVYVKPAANEMVFSFAAEATSGEPKRGAEAADFAYFRPGEEPANALPKQIERVADAASHDGETVFRIQDGPPGLEVLGLKSDSE